MGPLDLQRGVEKGEIDLPYSKACPVRRRCHAAADRVASAAWPGHKILAAPAPTPRRRLSRAGRLRIGALPLAVGSRLIDRAKYSCRGNAPGLSLPLVHVLARQPVRSSEGCDPLSECSFLALQSLGLAFAFGQFDQKLLNQRGYRGVALGRDHTRAPIGFMVQWYCDIFHVSTFIGTRPDVNGIGLCAWFEGALGAASLSGELLSQAGEASSGPPVFTSSCQLVEAPTVKLIAKVGG